MKKTALILAAVAGLASTASAQNWNFASLSVSDVIQGIDLNGAGVAAGTYNYVDVSLDWVAGGGNPWSNEAIWALTSADFSGGVGTPTFYADPGSSPDSLSSGDPVTLTWSGFLDFTYSGGDSLWFNTLQTFGGSDATWNNVSITLSSQGVSTPAATDLGVIGNEGNYTFDTNGSTYDTEIGLYDMDGNLLGNDDDGGDGLQSLISGDLAEGMYFIAVGGFNSTFGPGFGASGGSAAGDYNLNINGSMAASGASVAGEISWFKVTVVPTPASAGLLAMGGLVATRRRR